MLCPSSELVYVPVRPHADHMLHISTQQSECVLTFAGLSEATILGPQVHMNSIIWDMLFTHTYTHTPSLKTESDRQSEVCLLQGLVRRAIQNNIACLGAHD